MSPSPAEPHILLEGVVGSHAYGLARDTSDTDYLGVYLTPTSDLVSLTPPVDTISTSDPDRTLHEIGKYVRLALKANPTLTELMWLPDYTTCTNDGTALVHVRTAFLSAPAVRHAYLGYARSQLAKARSRTDHSFSADTRNRSAKHARHLARIVHQGYELYTTGQLTVTVTDPSWYHDFGNSTIDTWTTWLEEQTARYDNATSALPGAPDTDTVNDWLIDLRRRHWA